MELSSHHIHFFISYAVAFIAFTLIAKWYLAGAVLVGAAARICARITLGDPGTAGTIPVVIEVVLPILLFALLPFVSKDRRE
ncbi:MAG TPA: hypothetical protein VH278_11490 [Burkholderiaceae bacterium]|nr:hypothetical protein [Burkholderiaceae bacterium]